MMAANSALVRWSQLVRLLYSATSMCSMTTDNLYTLRILTLCFHFMHWTNSSCIKWASRPLCFIFFGSSFWYLQASERKERKVLINWYDNRAMRWAKHHRTRPVSLIKVEGIEVTRIQTQKVEHTYSHRQPYWLTQTDRQKYIRKRTRRVSEQERRK